MNKTHTSSKVKIWLTAVRPFAYTASLLPVLLGLAISVYLGFPVKWGLFGLTLLGVLCFHTAANLLNDCYDHKRGLDRDVLPMSGAIVRGWLSEKQVFRAAMLCLVLGTSCGLALTHFCGWGGLALGGIGAVIALGYTRSGFCFKYFALGDAVIFIAFGILPVFGTYWVQSQTFSLLPLLWSIPISCYTVGILHGNNWHDLNSDAASGCRTVANLLGPNGSRLYYRFLVLGPYVLTIAFLLAGKLLSQRVGPLTAGLVLLSVPLALKLSRTTPERDPDTFAMLDGRTAQLHLAFGALLTIGIFLGRITETL